MKKLLIVLAVAVIACAIIFAAFQIRDAVELNKYKKLTPDYVSYSHGGGMDGSRYTISLQRNESDEVILEISTIDAVSHEKKVQRFIQPESTINEINRILLEKRIPLWKNRPEGLLQVLDAPTTSVCIMYPDETINVSLDMKLPRGASEAFAAVCDYLEGLDRTTEF